jgi:hypothetical protein
MSTLRAFVTSSKPFFVPVFRNFRSLCWTAERTWHEEVRFPPPHYPATFEALIPPLQRPLPSTIINIPSLLARLQLTHHRLGPLQRSPPFLVPFFWPWACCATFPITYLEYLCATNAMEHVRLAFVRWKDASSSYSSGLLGGPASAASLGVPTRLKDRIRSHPPYSLRTSRLVTLSLCSCFDIGRMALGTTRSGSTSTKRHPICRRRRRRRWSSSISCF